MTNADGRNRKCSIFLPAFASPVKTVLSKKQVEKDYMRTAGYKNLRFSNLPPASPVKTSLSKKQVEKDYMRTAGFEPA